MTEKHVIELVGKDGASRMFKEAGRSSGELNRNLEKTKQIATATGVAVGTLVGVTAKLSQAHQNEVNQTKALTRVYGEAAGDIEELASQLQSMGVASDDATRIAALGAQSLAKNYGFTTDEISKLITRSADLTRTTFDQNGNMLGLADVMQRVSGAMRGEAESAEILGVAMGDQALAAMAAADGLTGWTTTMTESEKAQYRLKVFMDQTNVSAGAAAEYSETAAGKMNALR
jgi:hypothetical protein